jgi:hypothetical protein
MFIGCVRMFGSLGKEQESIIYVTELVHSVGCKKLKTTRRCLFYDLSCMVLPNSSVCLTSTSSVRGILSLEAVKDLDLS